MSEIYNKSAFELMVKNINHFLDNIEGYKPPGFGESANTLCIDAPWGTGKSVFLNYLQQNDNEQLAQDYEKNAVFINAFQYDMYSDPIVAIISEMVGKLELKNKELAKNIISWVSSNISLNLQVAPFGVGGGITVANNNAANGDKTTAQDLNKLKDGVNKLNDKFLIIIDELDRCKPTFAISLLEITKHLFNVEKMAFIFACDRRQLSNAVSGVYGSEYNGNVYLNRFFSKTLGLAWDEGAMTKFVFRVISDCSNNGIKRNTCINIWKKNKCITPRDIIEVVNEEGIFINWESGSCFEKTGSTLIFCYFLLEKTIRHGEHPFKDVAPDASNLVKILEMYIPEKEKLWWDHLEVKTLTDYHLRSKATSLLPVQ